MKTQNILPALALAGGSVAQTPAGFTPSVSAHLDVIFGTKVVNPPGTPLSKSDTARQPTIGTSKALNGTYVWMMIDLDASTNFANPKAGQQATYLHTVLRDFKSSGKTTDSGVYTLTTTATGPVSWFGTTARTVTDPGSIQGPAPPAENPPHPHRYTNLLWEQPANWAIPQAASTMLQSKRSGFNVTDFQKAAGLSDPVFANYFNVTG
ncbi:uncharacterized protein JN550_012240 [Neoarthrinium moseri]|uniref:uncharacterized protein n=1 Tax=Neoarthrinium moseri TaxID=1658444 RepID=UPI001FDE334D|nr:uncharacterized protein JN550_012240 [Neoarthrinium moseri]KAI1858978.1 hypothetical protein JN550_012240 [Neoarthrinium moseri]